MKDKTPNPNRVIGQVLASAVKRLKSSGLPAAQVEKAIAAIKGEVVNPNAPLLVKPSVRKYVFGLIKAHGPLVFTARKHLKVFRLGQYDNMRAASSRTAKKHSPWLKSSKKTVIAETK